MYINLQLASKLAAAQGGAAAVANYSANAQYPPQGQQQQQPQQQYVSQIHTRRASPHAVHQTACVTSVTSTSPLLGTHLGRPALLLFLLRTFAHNPQKARQVSIPSLSWWTTSSEYHQLSFYLLIPLYSPYQPITLQHRDASRVAPCRRWSRCTQHNTIPARRKLRLSIVSCTRRTLEV